MLKRNVVCAISVHQLHQGGYVKLIILDQAPEGCGEFDANVAKSFVIELHRLSAMKPL